MDLEVKRVYGIYASDLLKCEALLKYDGGWSQDEKVNFDPEDYAEIIHNLLDMVIDRELEKAGIA